ncbi:MAG: potassium transporter TrkG [Varibaculum sp.]|nr:potassium transporter TrkG [Varibaculum sp.]
MKRLRDWVDKLAKNSPARLTLAVFASIVALSTLLLQLPLAARDLQRPEFSDSLFTATSAVCVTGLTTVDTATYWSPFGQLVILLSIQIGGLGVMTLASILALAVSRHVGLTQRIIIAKEQQSTRLGDVGSVIKAAVITSLSVEVALFAILLPRLLALGESGPSAFWNALFMSVSIFNNAGFVTLPEGLSPHVGDWFITMPILFGTLFGALGFPVMQDLSRNWRRPRHLSLHSKLTITTYMILAGAAVVMVAASEWNNAGTFGQLNLSEKIQTALLFGVNSRSSGLTTIDIGAMTRGSWFLIDVLMFIGGGSASTAGGIKVTTLAVMVLAIVAEARGDRDTEAFHRRIPDSTVRLAVAVTMMGATLVAVSIFYLLQVTEYSLDVIGFEVISAFATVGLSTGITPDLPPEAKYVLAALMFAGRTGIMTVATALAIRQRRRVIRMPEEAPSIG